MSRAHELLNTMKTDKGLQEQMQAAATGEDRRKILQDAGIGDVSSADVKAANAANPDELSDEQLGAASGAGGLGFGQIEYRDCWNSDW